jgi:glycosyltransferase involved in cell wall biosynthesis
VSSSQPPPLLLSVFSTFSVGGPQVRFAAIANHFGRGVRHVVVSMDGDYACSERLDATLDIDFWPIEIRKGHTFANRRTFRQVLRVVGPDCLVTYNWGAIEWAMANLPRMVRHIHVEDGFGPEEAGRQLRRRIWARRILLRRTELVVPSRRLEQLSINIWKLKSKHIHYIPNGIDVGRFANAKREPRTSGDDRPVIGTVAALREEKNLVRLLDAFRLVRNTRTCRLVISGDGPEREKLETHAEKLGVADDVTFTGHRNDVERIYADIDVFALSSDTEQMPTTVIEAMAAALPIASTNVGDVSAMVAPLNRKFVVSADTQPLADAINELLDNQTLRRDVGAANQERCRREFSEGQMFEAYRQLFAPTKQRGSRSEQDEPGDQ